MPQHRHNSEYGQSWSIAAALLDEPKDLDGLKKHYQTMTRRFGIYTELLPGQRGFHNHGDMGEYLKRSLEELDQRGWTVVKEGFYSLTDAGRAEAEKMLGEVEKNGQMIRRMTDPLRVSRVTLVTHGILAAVKLPAALLSGSVGLLNDALDTLLDSLSSLLVHWGIGRNRERLVSMVLLLFMFLTGLFSFYEAVAGLLSRRIPEPDFLAFIAVALSALLCSGLWFYQKFSGLKHQSLPLLTQALDSKNHVIVAGGVTAGLIASLLKIPYLDAVVGLVVSILILKGAAELLIDLVRTGRGEELDLSRYGFTGYDRHHRRQLKTWLLHQVEQGKIGSRDELITEARSSLDFEKIPVYRALGIADGGPSSREIEEVLEEIRREDLLEEREGFALSDAGRKLLLRSRGKPPGFSRLFGIAGAVFFVLTRLTLFGGLYLLLSRLQQLLPAGPAGSAGSGTPLFVWRWISLEMWQVLLLGAGAVLFVPGCRLIRLAGHMLHHRRIDPDRPEAFSLVREGPYRWMRHPMYAGMLLGGCGVGVSLASVWGLGLAGFYLVLMGFNARMEDRTMIRALPEDYGEFRSRTTACLLPPVLMVLLLAVFTLYVFFLFR